METKQKTELFYEPSDIGVVQWEENQTPFDTSEFVNIEATGWTKSTVQLDSRQGHKTFDTDGGQMVHFKEPDGYWEPLFEPIGYDLEKAVGLSVAPTTACYTITSTGVCTIGTVSFVLFKSTLGSLGLDDNQVALFFENADLSTIVGKSVTSVWFRDYDWGEKLDHIAIGRTESSSPQVSYYVFDHSHMYKGPSARFGDEHLLRFDISRCFWPRKFVDLTFDRCLPYIERIENITDNYITRLCTGWAVKLGEIDESREKLYIKAGRSLSSWLIKERDNLRRELEIFFSGARYSKT